MSEYLRVLKRIDSDRRQVRGAPSGRAVRRDTTTPQPPIPAATAPVSGTPPSVAPAKPQAAAAFRQLFDNIRILAEDNRTRALVFVGASGIEPVEAVTAGFAAHIEGLGLDVLRAELGTWNGRPILRRRTCEAGALPSAGDPLPLDLGMPAAQVELTDWLEGATRTADVTIIEASSLSESVDAALLARACSGLVIVAQTEVTRRDALQLAAERARQVGCRTFGVVMYGSEKRVPGWVRRLLGGGRRQALEQQ